MKKRKKFKQVKLSRIRVAALKARKLRRELKKNPNGAASKRWQECVTNCTIPVADLSAKNFEEIEAFGHKIIVNTEIRDDGNGKLWKKGGEPNYVAIREKIKKSIRDNTAHMEHRADGTDFMVGKYKYKGKRKPWYMLDTRKTYHYEERKSKWGTATEFFRVPSEATKMYNKTIIKKMGKCAFMEALVQHKLARWMKKPGNERPIKDNCKEPDLFESQYIPEWEKRRDLAEERFRDFVVSIYDKLPLYGRFKTKDNKYVEHHIMSIKDVNGEGHKINDLDPNKSKLLNKVQFITDTLKKEYPSLICTNIKDHVHEKGRIVLPKAA